ncbi:hypothetical protein LTR10_009257 [Elasticomyces elasticus]|nr:hypothetical protein LTR10_009257 [Elasticomyces elasticus]KAK4971644.1 hypothetical protein LTR42_007372 [Elasticomyces elasticus]
MPDPPKIRMRTFYTPLVGFESALHRRGNSWYIVFPRAYGMLYGVKLHGVLNDERTAPNHDPPSSSESDLNPRFWFRDGSDYVDGEVNLRVRWHDLVTADPQFLKDSGLRRTVRLGDGKEVEERLVEVLWKEEELCQRCRFCGVWEYCYEDSVRHREVDVGKDGRPVYWCGRCWKLPKLLRKLPGMSRPQELYFQQPGGF